MNVRIARIILLVNAALHILFGMSFLSDPKSWIQKLSLDILAPAALTELRTFYGGFLVAIGAVFALFALRKKRIVPGLELMTITYGGAVAVRLYGLYYDNVTSGIMYNVLAIEGVGFLSGLIGLWLTRKMR